MSKVDVKPKSVNNDMKRVMKKVESMQRMMEDITEGVLKEFAEWLGDRVEVGGYIEGYMEERVRKVGRKEVKEGEQCVAIKANGDRCKNEGKYDGLCKSHDTHRPLRRVDREDEGVCRREKKKGKHAGDICGKKAMEGEELCKDCKERSEMVEKEKCKGKTTKGLRCKKNALEGGYCKVHGEKEEGDEKKEGEKKKGGKTKKEMLEEMRKNGKKVNEKLKKEEVEEVYKKWKKECEEETQEMVVEGEEDENGYKRVEYEGGEYWMKGDVMYEKTEEEDEEGEVETGYDPVGEMEGGELKRYDDEEEEEE